MVEKKLVRSALLTGAIATFALVAACNPTVAQNGAGGSGGSGGSGGEPVAPSCKYDAVLAIDTLLLGDTDPDGTPNPTNAWKQYGFNLDGLVSDKTSTDLCKPTAGGSPAAVYPDGNDGIDNSFGKNVWPIFLGLASDLSLQNNEAIAVGEFSHLLSMASPGQAACPNGFYLGGKLGQPPLFDGSDLWPIDASSLNNPQNPASAKCVFPELSVQSGIAKSGQAAQYDFVLSLGFVRIALPIQHVRLEFSLNADKTMATAGQLGGIIAKEDLVKAVAAGAAAFDTSFCDPSSPTLISILNQMRQGSDIMIDGTQDPTKECDGISIGFGFTMKAVQFGDVVTVPPPASPCAP